MVVHPQDQAIFYGRYSVANKGIRSSGEPSSGQAKCHRLGELPLHWRYRRNEQDQSINFTGSARQSFESVAANAGTGLLPAASGH